VKLDIGSRGRLDCENGKICLYCAAYRATVTSRTQLIPLEEAVHLSHKASGGSFGSMDFK
jgi:hypothetical protein